jgi:F-type H+-transporting ATPase subunit epsilon
MEDKLTEKSPEKKLHLKIITHGKVVFDADVDEIYSKAEDGEFGILPNHIPFMCGLDIGVTHAIIGEKVESFTTMGGVFQLKDNQALILTQSAEHGSDIDVARAKEAKERAEERLAESKEDVDVQRAEIALARALIRLKASTDK